ncbi:hypothetical protein CDV31_006679 [Fusarium ambrosium]|uniref:Uncharacterized protein n=1 Tax=Fusarium ambrosium TaxID=131363 RepID=A0A428UBC6_9HYPO|nr:hypothetical protein CDV31_006679 [Fusarium ambrosium]
MLLQMHVNFNNLSARCIITKEPFDEIKDVRVVWRQCYGDAGMPQKGGKSTQRGRPMSTEFGQLETTPTFRHFQSPEDHLLQKPVSESQGQDNSGQTPSVKNPTANQKPKWNFVDDFDDGVDDVDLIKLDLVEEPKSQRAPANDFSWSDTGSIRPSSPLGGGETLKEIWQFDNQGSLIDAFSSPKSGQGIPKTQPLTQSLKAQLEESPNQPVVVVDFSETASTGRRSSPFPSQIATEESWELLMNKPLLASTIPDSLQLPEMPIDPPEKPLEHLPADELYDATPPRPSAQRPVSPPPQRPQAPRKSVKHDQDPAPPQPKKTKRGPNPPARGSKRGLAQLIEETDLVKDEEVSVSLPDLPKPRETRRKGNNTSAVQAKGPAEDKQATPQAQDDPSAGQGQKGKKRKQRAKTPIEFDKDTQAIREAPNLKKVEPVRMKLVDAMIASSSPGVSAGKKAAPKATRKAAPKSTSKPATRKAPPKKKRKISAEEEYKDNSVIIVDTTKHTGPKSAINTRAKTAAQSKPKAARGKQGSEINTGSQGLPQDPIVVPSDPASSSISEDESERTEPSRPSRPIHTATQNSMAGTDVTTMAAPDISLEHDTEQAAVLPQEPPPSPVAPQPSNTLKAKEAIVDKTTINPAASAEPVEEAINLRKRSHETNAKPAQALSRRDPNIPVKGALRTTQGAGISKNDPSTRANKTDSRGSDLQQRYISGLAAAEPNHDKTRIELKARLRNEEEEQERNLLPALTALNKNLQSQIFESLRGQDEAPMEVDKGKRTKTTDKDNEVAKQTDPEKPADEVAEKLHALVETMLSHLATKEATVYRGADAYRKSGIDCMDKIEQRYSQERNALAEACKKDGDRFARRVREAREAVEDGEKARGKAMHQLEQATAKRRQLYQQASTSLRALHGRLLKRKRVEDEGI